jgi:hypothetical protein
MIRIGESFTHSSLRLGVIQTLVLCLVWLILTPFDILWQTKLTSGG